MRYVVILAALIGGVVLAKTYFTDTGQRISTEMSTAVQPSPQDANLHFTAEDLVKVGCKVAPELGRYSQADIPLLGTMKMYVLRSESGCKVGLTSQITAVKEDDPGVWAGVRAGASVAARKNGFDVGSEEGNLGEYSEIHRFTQNGVSKGFTYAIQNKGLLHSITIMSDEIAPDAELESVIAAKL